MNTLIRVGMSTCGLAAGAQVTYQALAAAIRSRGLPVTLQATGCVGACHREPLVEVAQNGASILYGPVTPAEVGALLDLHFGAAQATADSDWLVSRQTDRHDYPFLGKQVKVTTQLCGVIDPHSLDDYLAHDGYQALRQALAMTCLLYTSPSPRDRTRSRMPSSA